MSMTTQPNTEVANIVKSNRGKNWEATEDQQLCRSWIHISENSLIGDEQKGDDFWIAVKADADSVKDAMTLERPFSAFRTRWTTVQKRVSAYTAEYDRAKRNIPSGTNTVEQTVISLYTIIIIDALTTHFFYKQSMHPLGNFIVLE